MTRLGQIVRVAGATFLAAAALLGSVILGMGASTSTQSHDVGIGSAFAVVSNEPVGAFQADLNIINVKPEEGAVGRLSFQVFGGDSVSDGARLPKTSVTPVSRADERLPDQHAGFSIILGGNLGAAIDTCDESSYVLTYRDLTFAELSELERNAITANIEQQGIDRVVTFGTPVDQEQAQLPAVKLAQAMRYTVVDFGALSPKQRFLNSRSDNQPDSEGTATGPPVEYVGYEGLAICSYTERTITSTQSWGSRFEFPPITAYAAADKANSHVQSVRRVYRVRETPQYTYIGGASLENSKVEENWNGLYAVSNMEDGWSVPGTGFGASHVSQLTLSFQRTTFSQERDIQLFAAGAMLSLAAAMCIAIAKTVAGAWLNKP